MAWYLKYGQPGQLTEQSRQHANRYRAKLPAEWQAVLPAFDDDPIEIPPWNLATDGQPEGEGRPEDRK